MDQFPDAAAAITQTFINTLRDAHLASPPPPSPLHYSSSVAKKDEFPPFYNSPQDLITTAQLKEFHASNGYGIIKLICRELLTAKHEILFVTGFWAKSPSRGVVNATLRELNRIIALENASNEEGTRRKITVRIGFSSCSLSQKLFQTSSTKGKIWDPKTWVKKLGLPRADEIPNVDLQVKSLFFRPVSLLHGKFALVDQRRLLLPSANVSFEDLIECCGIYEGGIVGVFVRFWEAVWGRGYTAPSLTLASTGELPSSVGANDSGWPNYLLPAPRLKTAALPPGIGDTSVQTVFLPHPHHACLPPVFPLAGLPDIIYRIIAEIFAFITFSKRPPRNENAYLSNPQNAFWVSAIDSAKTSIYLHTPNITSSAIRSALLRALERQVNVEIVTSRRMMSFEQIVTAGTTTERCMKKFAKAVKKLGPDSGACYVYWFDPSVTAKDENGEFVPSNSNQLVKAAKSHVKCLIVDEEAVMLGSGNADRASWVTSQEVNVGLFPGKESAKAIRSALVDALANRFVVQDNVGDDFLDSTPGQVLLRAEPKRRLETV